MTLIRESYHHWVWDNADKTKGHCSRCSLKREMKTGPRKGDAPAFMVDGKWEVTRTPPLCRETVRASV